MMDTLTFNGRTVRVEVNWNAIVAFLEASGRDTWDGLKDVDKLRPSDIAPLMAACINEGERLDGRESNLTGKDVGATADMSVISAFVDIYVKQSGPAIKPEASKKE